MHGGLIHKKYWIKYISYLTIFIYFIFLFIDITHKDLGAVYSIYLKYTEIILLFILTLLIGSDGYNKRDTFLVQLARFFTLAADYLLMIVNNYKFGIISFCIVQIIYIIRHTAMEKAKFKNIVFLFSVLVICLIILLNIDISSIDTSLFLSALVYACFLITSVYCAVSTIYRSSYPRGGAFMAATGMILFFLCDANVGIYNLTSGMQVSFFHIADINFLIGFLMWFFYLPSQFLLSLSGFKPDYLKKVFWQ